MSILIVEDNPVNAKVLAFMLRGEGYQIVVARNGKDALVTMSKTPGIQLIITDYMMPEMDGLEFIVKVRALPTFRHVPVLIASAHAGFEIVKRAQSLQCDGFLIKPIDKAQLIKRVKPLLQSKPPVLLDRHITMGRLGFGPDEYHELVNEFEAQVTAVMPIMALERGESGELISENLRQVLKELVESAATLGADKFVLLYSAYIGGGQLTRSQCPVLLEALQELKMAIEAYTQSQPDAVGETDAA